MLRLTLRQSGMWTVWVQNAAVTDGLGALLLRAWNQVRGEIGVHKHASTLSQASSNYHHASDRYSLLASQTSQGQGISQHLKQHYFPLKKP